MNSVPAAQRGAANGMMSTFQNSGMVLSIGIFFSLMIVGLAAKLPTTMFAGLTANGVPAAQAHQIANLPPVGDLFASFLGFNPLGSLLSASPRHRADRRPERDPDRQAVLPAPDRPAVQRTAW